MATAGHSWSKLRGSSDGKWAPRSGQIGRGTKFQHLIVTYGKQHVLAIALTWPLLLYQIREQRSVLWGAPLEVHRA